MIQHGTIFHHALLQNEFQVCSLVTSWMWRIPWMVPLLLSPCHNLRLQDGKFCRKCLALRMMNTATKQRRSNLFSALWLWIWWRFNEEYSEICKRGIQVFNLIDTYWKKCSTIILYYITYARRMCRVPLTVRITAGGITTRAGCAIQLVGSVCAKPRPTADFRCRCFGCQQFMFHVIHANLWLEKLPNIIYVSEITAKKLEWSSFNCFCNLHRSAARCATEAPFEHLHSSGSFSWTDARRQGARWTRANSGCATRCIWWETIT